MRYKTIIFSLIITLFSLYDSNAQDWANLKRYQQENTTLKSLKTSEKRVVFMGNSITEGWLRVHPSFFEAKPYVDRGISGQTTPQMVLRFRQDVIDLNPNVVVILAGINDIAQNTGPMTLEETAGNIFSMAELAKSNGIKVIICSVLPAAAFPWRPEIEPGAKVVALNTLLSKYAKKNDIPFVDYYTPMVNDSLGLKKELGDDGVHPNEKGYMIMEPIIEKAISKILKTSKK